MDTDRKLGRLQTYGGTGLWIRAAYRDGFSNKSITAVVRRGDRSNPTNARFLPDGEGLPVRFIRVPGDQARNTPPELFEDEGITVRIISYMVKRIENLTTDDLEGCSPDAATPELVRYHLAIHENTALPSPDEIVTVWRFEYVS